MTIPIFCIQKESWATVQDSAGGGYEIRKYIVIPTILCCSASLELSLELYLQHSCLYITSVCLHRCKCPRIAGESMFGFLAGAETPTTKQQIKNVTRAHVCTAYMNAFVARVPRATRSRFPRYNTARATLLNGEFRVGSYCAGCGGAWNRFIFFLFSAAVPLRRWLWSICYKGKGS